VWGVGTQFSILSGQDDQITVGPIPPDKGYSASELAALRERGTRRVWRGAERFAVGMPVGGICAGQLYLLGDGSLGGWHVDGRLNATGYGSTSYQPRQADRELLQRFVLETKEEGGEVRSSVLADPEAGGDYDAIEFVGEYPIGEVRYLSTARSEETRALPPLRVTLRAYSPFQPLQASDSGLPCTVMRFELANDTDRPVEGFLSGLLENGVQRDMLGKVGAPRYRNTVLRGGGITSIGMSAIKPAKTRQEKEPRPERILADFEGKDHGGWTAQGEAFGGKPAAGTLPDQNPVSGFEGEGLVNSFLGGDGAQGRLTSRPFVIDRRYLMMLVGGGNHPGKTCVNLVVDGEVVQSVTGRNSERLEREVWDLGKLKGREGVLEIIDEESGGWGHINVDRISLRDDIPEEMQRPRPDDLTGGTMALSMIGEGTANPNWNHRHSAFSPPRRMARSAIAVIAPIASVSGAFRIEPGESTEIVFLVSWHFPNLHTGQHPMYTTRFGSASEVAKHVAGRDGELWDATRLFHRTLYEDTTLPWWLVSRLFMPLSNLATGTAQWWDDGRFWGWEGVGCCGGTCTHVWNYSHAEARLFPELARSTRTMQDLGSAFEVETGRVAFRGEVDGGHAYAADGQAGTVLKCYREHLTSPDDGFLRENWPRIQKVLEYQIVKDAELSGDGQPDGILVCNQHNTYDIDFLGANSMVGSLYLAALLAGARMAEEMDDGASATRYRKLYESGRKWTEENLFDGEYFTQRLPEGADDRFQYVTGCLSDQLFGQTWARLLALGTVYDEEMVRTVLGSIYRYNFAPAVGVYNELFPPERYFAREKDGGLLLCTWPRGGRPGQPVRYKDEVWTGIEYQVATSMVWEGMIDEALVILRAIDKRYDGLLHNPWNEVECGDHYARAMASFGVFQALAGFEYDGPAMRLGMAPRLGSAQFSALFVASEGWGSLQQEGDGTKQTNRVILRAGALSLREFTAVPLAAGVSGVRRAKVTLGGKTLAAKASWKEGRAVVTLDAAVVLGPDDVLEVSWEW
jgi:non-lysosomal glucosylceramidase